MCVMLPATLNIHLSSTLGEMHKVFGYHYFVTKKKKPSGDAQCYNKDCSSPQGWEFDSKWSPKGGEIDI